MIVTVAGADVSPAVSRARYVNENVPPPDGVYVNPPFALRLSVPLAGPVSSTAVKASPSGSVSPSNTPGGRRPPGGASVEPWYESLSAVGASLSGVMMIVTVPVELPALWVFGSSFAV